MRHTGFLCTLIAGLTLAVATPSFAAGTLSVSGPANTAVDWQVTKDVDLTSSAPAITSSSRLFGIAIEDLQTHTIAMMAYDGSAIYAKCGLDAINLDCGHSSSISNRDELTLEPGRYRLRLFGEGTGTVSMPITKGAGSLAFATDQPAKPAVVEIRDPRALAPASIAHDVIEFDFPQGSNVSYLIEQRAKSQFVGPGAEQMCLRRVGPNATCQTDQVEGDTGALVAAAYGDGYAMNIWFGYSDFMPPGRYAGEFTQASTSTADLIEVLVAVAPS